MPTTGPPLGDAPKKCQLPTKQEGEECGSCFSPDTNFTCGTCASGLDCVKDPANKLLPDAPARCKKAAIVLIPIESNPCDTHNCGVNAECKVNERLNAPPLCLCRVGYTGDPFDRCVREELKIPCRNPGKNVPSPHDVCNTCQCSEDGILGGCTKRLCIPEVVEANPFEKLLYCATNDANYCEEKTDGEFNSCHNLPQPSCFIDNKTVKNCYGVCVPEDVPCNSRHPCKPIGNTSSGQLTSRCLNNKCVYAPALVIA